MFEGPVLDHRSLLPYKLYILQGELESIHFEFENEGDAGGLNFAEGGICPSQFLLLLLLFISSISKENTTGNVPIPSSVSEKQKVQAYEFACCLCSCFGHSGLSQRVQ